MILIANPSHDTDTAIDILFRSTTDRLASHCRSRAVPGSDLNWKRLGRVDLRKSGAGVGVLGTHRCWRVFSRQASNCSTRDSQPQGNAHAKKSPLRRSGPNTPVTG